MNTTQALGRIETCSCCGKDIKRPVTMRQFPGAQFGKNCRDDIQHVRSLLLTAHVAPGGEEMVVAGIKRDWPRTGDKLIEWARAMGKAVR